MDRDDSSEDELDKLTRTFEEQASKDLHLASKKQNAELSKLRKTKGMKEVREEGLQAPVPEESRGFKMLSQMGYQKGQGLGRNQTGRSEPVDILIKDKRTGLGMDEEQKRKREEAEKMQVLQDQKRQQLGSMMQKDFALHQSARLAEKRQEGQLRNARKVIETLDRRKGLEHSFLWPLVERAESEAEVEEDGKKEDDGENVEAEDKEPTWEDQPVKGKLMTALSYLRNHYSYCFYCATQYANAEELAAQCPGLLDEDH